DLDGGGRCTRPTAPSQIAGGGPKTTAIDADAANRLAREIGGSVVGPGDDAYDQARRVFNGMIDRRPRLIARCVNEADVATAIAFARDHALAVAVRGGGHNVAGNAVVDGGR